MKGKGWIWTVVIVAVGVLGVWIARNTYWDDLKVPMPPKGEALINPFYATQRFAERLGATTKWDRALVVPPSNAVIVLSWWHWSVGRGRQVALQQWVESGGRLVVDNLLVDPAGEFVHWSGIDQQYPDEEQSKEQLSTAWECRQLHEDRGEAFAVCDIGLSWLENTRSVEWVLRDKAHIQAARVRIGRGSVTVINASPFRNRGLFDGDHGRLFVAVTQLRRGDEVHFMSEDDYPGLLTLMWQRGAPVVAVGLVVVGFLLWRAAMRFGPMAPVLIGARRSLADQIRGSGRFALQYGDGVALHTACVRALEEAARRRISGYAALEPDERAAALARVTGFDRVSISAAIYHPGRRATGELHRTIALLEAARRETLKRRRSDDATR